MDDRIWITPQSYGPEQRIEASQKATEVGRGLRMEVHSGHTEFFSDSTVPVGKVAIHCSLSYKAWPEYVTTLDAPDQLWETPLDRAFRERIALATSANAHPDRSPE